MKNILVTGGAGYIGSHTCVELAKAGYGVIVVDNLVNSKYEAVRRLEKIIGKPVKFYENDILDAAALDKIFTENRIDAVINFAGLKAVGESVEKPLEYYHNNITGMLVLLEVMRAHGCKNIVFSSSATVYGNPHAVPIKEDFPLSATNPYGRTKLFIEDILRDLYKADKSFNIAILRYFNPVGAHESGLIGEDPNGIPNNLCPYITKVAVGKLAKVRVFGNDYPTPDGTGVRDYIHVCDLAVGHVLALRKLFENSGLYTVNLGTGIGYSVLDVIKAFSKALGKEIPYEFAPRRAGDIPECYADPSLAESLIGFRTTRSLDDMCRDALNFQLKNPNGYEE
ncbi:MAG TPA: UDP-glucose 4-epimerase GalE [Candidatus Borkfalkia stercoripullorum]|nr:UDP-glucose 4-epimerase GalE [Candidatus Borkfalkia stercoripullorum]